MTANAPRGSVRRARPGRHFAASAKSPGPRSSGLAPALSPVLWAALVPALVPALSACSGCGDGEDVRADKLPALAAVAERAAATAASARGASPPAGEGRGDGSADAGDPAPSAGPTPVDLSGRFTPPAPIPDGAPRLASTAMLTDVHARPSRESRRVGALRAGAIVEMDPAEAGRDGCPGGWRRIKPYGFVCLGPEATLDLEHPIVRASTRRPDFSQKLPYMYGVVTRGGPVYARIPRPEDIDAFEPSLETHLAKWKGDEVSGASYGAELWYKWKPKRPVADARLALEARATDDDIPHFLRDGKVLPNLSGRIKSARDVKIDQVDRRNGVAFVDSFLHEGRRYNVTTDLRLVPADRFRPIRGSDFHGVEIGKDIDFPFALVRRPKAKKWRLDGKKLVSDGDLPWRSAVALTGKQQFFGKVLHYEAKEGFWVDDRHAGRVDPAKKMPAWGKNGEKWIDVNVTKQVLVAYEGTKPVFATLVSTGEHGLEDPETSRATKRGIFRIHTKHASITMDSDATGEEFELRDVPYVQYFEGGYALHGAYWHDSFGRPKSHGCINLAPEDARRLFFWTEPSLPPGWHGVARPLTGTVIFVHP